MTPEKIAGQEFAHSFRGYDISDVRGFLARVAGEVRRVEEALERTRAELAEAETRPPPSIEDLTRDQLNQLLGEEAARVLRTADDAARDIRTRAEANVEKMLHEAQAEAKEIRAEAERIREEARAEADQRVSGADEIVATRLAEADSEALRRREAAIEEGRAMLAEAKEARERMLADLAQRRRDSRRELYQLRAGIEQLRESYDELRSMLDRSVTVVDTAVEDARRAAGYAAERFDRDDMADDRAELGRELGLDREPSLPRPGSDQVEDSGLGEVPRLGSEAGVSDGGGEEAQASNSEDASIHEAGVASEPDDGVGGPAATAPGATGGIEEVETQTPEDTEPVVVETASGADSPAADEIEGERSESASDPGHDLASGHGASGPTDAGDTPEMAETPDDSEELGSKGEDHEPAMAGPEGAAPAAPGTPEAESGANGIAEIPVGVEAIATDTVSGPAGEDGDPGIADADAAAHADAAAAAELAPVGSGAGSARGSGEPLLFDQDVEDEEAPPDHAEPATGRERSRIIYRREPRPDSTLAGIVSAAGPGEGPDSPVLEELQAALDRAVARGDAPDEPQGGEPAPDPALVAVESALSAAELDEVFGGPTNFTRDDSPPGPLGGPHAEIDELFARIREARETSVSKAREVLDRPSTVEAAAPAERSSAAEVSPAPSRTGGVEALFRRQEQVASSVEKKISRLMKRGLADQLNEVLDGIRRSSDSLDIDDVLPAASVRDLAGELRPLLVEAVLEGAGRLEGSEEDLRPETLGALDELVDSVSRDMDSSLRSRMEGFLAEPSSAESGARGLYREWRRERLGPLARDIALAAYAVGVLDPVSPGSEVRWVVPEGGCVHPDCDDNALATEVTLGSPFPSGHLRAPLAPGCRCLVVESHS